MNPLLDTHTGMLDLPLPPTQDELPYDDGMPMETARHKFQMELLTDPLMDWLQGQKVFIGGNMFVYYSLEQLRNRDFLGPDVFVVLDVPRGERKSWVVWEQGKGPDLIIELLSASTAELDKTRKKQLYQNQLKVTEYFWYDPFNPEDRAGFVLQRGVYESLPIDEQGRFISPLLDLALVLWQGDYKEINAVWLRWATPTGELLPTPGERAQQEQERAEQEQQRAEQERQAKELAQQRAEQLAERLRSLGIDPDAD